MKPGKDFKMSKQSKVLLASTMLVSKQVRGELKRALIDAQLAKTKFTPSVNKSADSE